MKTNEIVIHTTYTRPGQDIGVDEIRDWHVNGNGWRDIGYHYVIRRDGTVEKGRPADQQGAHVGGHNEGRLGIALVGGKHPDDDAPEVNYTRAQWAALETLVKDIRRKQVAKTIPVKGHHDYPGHGSRWCPGFNVEAWLDE